ncbi:MMPL family transporter [Streptomyces actinomycinicus]|uniref:MMPL family transporter n=1 Tax=Streptomyces actinomycinicus TaxID=1695166 RepID=UPI0027DA6553|nr:MMPL family transporter [Streptomyces actinomycinicus]
MNERPGIVLTATALLLGMAGFLGHGVAVHLRNGGDEDPGSESSYATRILDRDFPGGRPDLILLAGTRNGVDRPLAARQGRALAARLVKEHGVAGVASYWTTRSPALRSRDGRYALITARLSGDTRAVQRAVDRIAPRYRGTRGALRMRIGGAAAVRREAQTMVTEDLTRAEAMSVPATLLILVFVFGSVAAALLPVCVGMVAIVGSQAVLRALAAATDISLFALNLTTALGLGLAVDYALLIVRRYREELTGGADRCAAIGTTLDTAGRTVLFSSVTVALSLATMLVFPHRFLRSMAYAGISVVVLSAGAALVVLPALLRLMGPRIDAWDVRTLIRPRRRAGRHAAPRYGAGWVRVTGTVMRRAPLFTVGTTGLLLLLGLPFLNVRFGHPDDRQLPAGAEARVVQQHIREGFSTGGGAGPEILVRGATSAGLAPYAARLSRLSGAERVDGPTGTYTAGARTGPPDPTRARTGDSWLSVVTRADATPAAAERLVRSVRDVEVPFRTYVTGPTAESLDSRAAVLARLPVAGVLVTAATLSLLLLLTGSYLVPLQALVLNALSLTAMFGTLVWVFQEGHMAGLLGFTPTGVIETTLPVLMAFLAFGLSMDYGVFLLSRVREEVLRAGDHRTGVVEGMRRTGGIITAAVLILAVVLLSVATSRTVGAKMLGTGVAVAVLADAFVVRALLVPAVLALTGRAAWLGPARLGRVPQREPCR